MIKVDPSLSSCHQGLKAERNKPHSYYTACIIIIIIIMDIMAIQQHLHKPFFHKNTKIFIQNISRLAS